MKKSLLALAVLTAITGAAHAQSSVTLYGKVDVGMTLDSGSVLGKDVRLSSGVTGGSRLGFKGVEDLGGGNKASFVLETGFCANGTSASSAGYCTGGGFMGRQAYGQLSGAFGSISGGRQYTQGFIALTTIDPFGTGYAGQINNLANNDGVRQNQQVQFTTPSISGLSAGAEIGFGGQTGNWQGSREVGGNLTYAAGPAYAAGTYYSVDNANGTGAAIKVYQLGGVYDFGVAKLHAMYQHDSGQPTDEAGIDKDVWMVGTTVPLGGGSLFASYVNLKDKSAADINANQVGIGYNYPLSKRTSIYTAYARISEPSVATSASNLNGLPYTVGNATDSGTGNKAFNLGVVHNF